MGPRCAVSRLSPKLKTDQFVLKDSQCHGQVRRKRKPLPPVACFTIQSDFETAKSPITRAARDSSGVDDSAQKTAWNTFRDELPWLNRSHDPCTRYDG
jgi:hypothetical protein